MSPRQQVKVSSGPEPPGLGGGGGGLECLYRHRVAIHVWMLPWHQVGPGSCSPEDSVGKTALGGWSADMDT